LVAHQRHYGMPSPFEPMLATSGALPEDDERWAYEPKWDGFRAIVHVNSRAVVWSRRGTDLTDRFPEVAELASAVPPDTVLDGELVVFDGSGRPQFEAIRQRGLLGRIEGAATFIAFDVLRLGGRNVLVHRFRTRRAALEDLALSGHGWCTTPSHEDAGGALFEATREQGLEGVVAKRLDSPYRPGVRTKLWIKAKHWLTGRFVVGGVTVGDERSVILVGAQTPAGLAYVGIVEVFGEAQLAGILSAARARATSPFTGWAPRALWLEPEVTVEVRYLAQGPGLRHAVLVPTVGPRSAGVIHGPPRVGDRGRGYETRC
jgi:bifunctional non-homologous end joining protein LigD